MSSRLLGHVWSLDLPDPTTKLVLLRLADNANDDTGECFPSIQYLQDKCSIKSKNTVKRALSILEELGLIIIVHRRVSDKQNKSNLYKLNIQKILNLKQNLGGSNTDLGGSNTDLGGGSNTDPITNNSSEPITEPNNTLTGVNACEKKSETLILLEQFGITDQLAKDFIVHRKSFKAPITETALKGFQREADKAKIPIQQAIAISIERGWRGFNAGWDWRDGGVSAKNPQNLSARNTSKPFIPDDEGNWAEGMSITVRGS